MEEFRNGLFRAIIRIEQNFVARRWRGRGGEQNDGSGRSAAAAPETGNSFCQWQRCEDRRDLASDKLAAPGAAQAPYAHFQPGGGDIGDGSESRHCAMVARCEQDKNTHWKLGYPANPLGRQFGAARAAAALSLDRGDGD
ncbi:MAG: hypothetical protein DI606_04300 [Sphingobium sp.]|nr:MAG: hypothetical protein DI606_04300 [Sphingobium sp.]